MTQQVVFADRREYLERIEAMLNEQQNEDTFWQKILDEETEKEIQQVISMTAMGGYNVDTLKQNAQKSNVILTTYQYMGTGLSIPKMNAIILATPRKSKCRQYINRIFRLGSDNTIERRIVDIVDWSTSIKSQWYARKKYYKEKNYDIEEIKVKYKDIPHNIS